MIGFLGLVPPDLFKESKQHLITAVEHQQSEIHISRVAKQNISVKR